MARDRRTEILDVAREVFLEQGYAAASMSTIASRVGGSKGTLYNYFDSKEQLFRAHIERECALSAENIFGSADESQDIASQLLDLGIRYLATLTSERVIANARAVVAEAGRNKEVGEIFYDAGPRAGGERLAQLFEQAGASNKLKIDDPQIAAHHFMALCQAGVYRRRLFNVGGKPSAKNIRTDIEAAVRTFMRAFAV
ncbi:MAG TPA: TetR/AcrR family transcriptional regulator [Sphingomicrobium sp.]|nr:TetR/AcrR family transcriptional regulator [Sphingomicrobium sp.]